MRDRLPVLRVLTADFGGCWGGGGPGGVVVPVPAHDRLDPGVVRRVTGGCRDLGVAGVRVSGAVGEPSAVVPVEAVGDRVLGLAPPVLLVAVGEAGALLFRSPGYALLAGTTAFLRGAVPEGVDVARARFGRYTRAVAHRWPEAGEVARALPPRHHAWSRAEEVPAGTWAGHRLELLRGFAAGEVTAAEFARGWPALRRRALEEGERLREPLSLLFDEVFALLEGYAPDPAFREPGDLSDAELREAVRGLVIGGPEAGRGWPRVPVP
ncbi:colicin immunity domain-containing protein [Streptomyces sp. LP05-1]|uniref:Colicin immunity domain-containing protein n=1 Tax=Streptomyces pyxinae TaxID=2970734 RepID=A0ABT2CNZ9_9ACTN|nr:colicin immunity domain-containing protein [Streptomyces sp. LP05-1]MCS0639163.1 colicin immunity domain-containing protein [Streptomyces sp. LP05-1]